MVDQRLVAVDTGFLLALADAGDRWHERAIECARAQRFGWMTTWPVLAETCHLLRRRLGSGYAEALLDDVAAGRCLVRDFTTRDCERMALLMRKYAALPMDLADASLVLLAEALGHGRILSTDVRDFGAYRWKNRKPFKNLMEPLV